MKKEDIEVFNRLLEDDTFKGKQQLKHLLWLNTVKPQFKVGDCFIVTDGGHSIFGKPVKDFKAKVVKIASFPSQEEWYYHLVIEAEKKGKKIESYVYKYEFDLKQAERADDNINILG